MKSFIRSLFILIVGIILGVFIVVFGLVSFVMSASKNIEGISVTTTVNKHSWLILDFYGTIREGTTSDFSDILSSSENSKQIEFLKYIKAIEYAGSDMKIEGIIINADFTFYDRVYVEEIINELKKFKESGKKVIAWFSTGVNNNYLLSSIADEIYMPNTKSADLTLKGYYLELPYYKKFLDKIGVSVDVIHIGNYKGSGENYSQESISPELYSSYISLMSSNYEYFINTISENRKIDKNHLLTLFSSGKTVFMSPEVAKNSGFIDGFFSFDDLKNYVSPSIKFDSISLYNYAKSIKTASQNDKIAVFYVDGTIYNYFTSSGNNRGMRDRTVGAKSFIETINKLKNDFSIKAVVLRVNSPGGSALASELMLQEIIKLRETKPVYISFGPIAASGGYYISCSANKIFASNSTITGSIGVVAMLPNLEGSASKLGVDFSKIKLNKYDDINSLFKTRTPDELEMIRNSMKDTYDEFTLHVSQNRNIGMNDLSKIAEGRIWSGKQAVDNGLVDMIGGLNSTIEFAANDLELSNYSTESYPKTEGFFEKLIKSSTVLFDGDFSAEYHIASKNRELKNVIDLYHYIINNREKCSMLLPFYDLP